MRRKKPAFLTQLLAVVLMDTIAIPPSAYDAALRAMHSRAVSNDLNFRTNSAVGGGAS